MTSYISLYFLIS